MEPLSSVEIENWLALYAATGVCCAFAVILSIVTMVAQLHREKVWTKITSARDAALFIPKTWWRWQKLYLLSTPVTLGIVGSFATTLSWR